MRDPNRIKPILAQIERIWSDNLDLRLGQLIVIATQLKEPCIDVFYKEDQDLLDGLLQYEKKTKKGS